MNPNAGLFADGEDRRAERLGKGQSADTSSSDGEERRAERLGLPLQILQP